MYPVKNFNFENKTKNVHSHCRRVSQIQVVHLIIITQYFYLHKYMSFKMIPSQKLFFKTKYMVSIFTKVLNVM